MARTLRNVSPVSGSRGVGSRFANNRSIRSFDSADAVYSEPHRTHLTITATSGIVLTYGHFQSDPRLWVPWSRRGPTVARRRKICRGVDSLAY